MSATVQSATISTVGEASRYLGELTATVGFDEARRRVERKADPAIARELEALQRFVGGGEPPSRAFAFQGEYFKRVAEPARASAGAAVLNDTLRAARALADQVRVGLPADLAYSGVLLAVAALISVMWFVYIAPQFASLFLSIGAQRLPALSQWLFDTPWLVFLLIGILAAKLLALVLGSWRVAAAIETMAIPNHGWLRWFAGGRVLRELEHWRSAALASAWAKAGEEPMRAWQSATAMASSSAELDAATARVGLADELGIGAQELEHERERALRDTRIALEVRRGLALRAMQIAIAVLVGAVVIAIYLPIFRMGAVI